MTTVLLSASGSPGSARLIRALHENGERTVRIVGTDMNENAIGRFLCDAFHTVPPGPDPAYADAILELVEREQVDVVLPQSSFDLQALSETRERFPVPVLAAPGVVQAETYLQEGETIRPVRLDGDRRGYVIAIADTNVEALRRAEAAARMLVVEVEP